MTNREIESFIKKNIIGYVGPNIIQKGSYILLHPFDDLLGGFCFERSASDKNSIYIWWFVQPLFIPGSIIHLTFGNRLENLHRNQSWENLDLMENIEKIREIIQKTIPLIKTLTDSPSFYDHYDGHPLENLRIDEALVYTRIWIESTNYMDKIKNLISDIDNKFDGSIPWIKTIKEDMINLSLSENPRSILADNKKNLIELLNL